MTTEELEQIRLDVVAIKQWCEKLIQTNSEQTKRIAELEKGLPHEQPLTDMPMDRQVVMLNRRLVELEKDKAMLDLLLSPGCKMGVVEVNSVNGVATWHFTRESIDSAINQTNKEGK